MNTQYVTENQTMPYEEDGETYLSYTKDRYGKPATFADWMKCQFSVQTMQAIANCAANGGFNGLIWHDDINELFAKYSEEIYEYYREISIDTDSNPLRENESFQDLVCAFVYFSAEYVAMEIINSREGDES
jgi:hypothetical protein